MSAFCSCRSQITVNNFSDSAQEEAEAELLNDSESEPEIVIDLSHSAARGGGLRGRMGGRAARERERIKAEARAQKEKEREEKRKQREKEAKERDDFITQLQEVGGKMRRVGT